MWRNRSWDSFTLVTPNWAFKMPGAKNNGAERDAFMPRHKVIEFFEDYAITFGLPVRYKTAGNFGHADGGWNVSHANQLK